MFKCKKCGGKFSKKERFRRGWNVCNSCGRIYMRKWEKVRYKKIPKHIAWDNRVVYNIRKGNRECRKCGCKLTLTNRKKYDGYICKKCGAAKEKKRYNRLKEAVKEKLGAKCTFCGTNEHIHYHHIIPKDLEVGGSMRYIKVLKDREIIMPLCVDCHIKWHEIKEWLGQIVM